MMKKTLILLILCLFAVMSMPAAAQPDKPATPAITGSDPHAGHGAPSSSPSPDVAKPQVTEPDADKHVQMMQGHTHKMRDQMEKIKAAKDPKERQKLMQEHKASMREGMKMMKSMPTCKMTSDVGMKGAGQGMMEMGNMMMCHQMMEKKLEMMQGMMEGLIESTQIKK
jgi:hypothetical protein